MTLPSLANSPTYSNQQLKARIKGLSPAIAGAISVAIGITALIGWAFHITLLKSFGLGLIAMNPVTAFIVTVAGGALVLLSDRQANRRRRLWGRVLAGIAAAVGLSRLLCIRYGCGCGNILDRWIFGCRFQHAPTHTESIDIQTALNILLAGLALVSCSTSKLVVDIAPLRLLVPFRESSRSSLWSHIATISLPTT